MGIHGPAKGLMNIERLLLEEVGHTFVASEIVGFATGGW
jgi:hypothetical protein